MSAIGDLRKFQGLLIAVRFTPESGHTEARCPFSAKTAPGSMTRPTSARGREAGLGVAGNHPSKTSFYGPALRRKRAAPGSAPRSIPAWPGTSPSNKGPPALSP